MLDEVHRHCKMWRVELNQKKTKVVVFGKRGVGGVSLRCGDMAIDEAAEYIYLGLIFEKRGWKKQREKMLRTARRAAAIAWGMVVQVGGMTTKGKSNIYNALVRPHLEYGAEILATEHGLGWEEGEELQRWVGKRILGSGKHLANEAVQGELGWMSLRGRRVMLRLSFWGKVLNMEKQRWVRRVYEASRAKHVGGAKAIGRA